MKTVLEFNLPEDEIELHHAQKGVRYYIAITEIREKFRSIEKYENKKSMKLEDIRQIIHDILRDNGLNDL